MAHMESADSIKNSHIFQAFLVSLCCFTMVNHYSLMIYTKKEEKMISPLFPIMGLAVLFFYLAKFQFNWSCSTKDRYGYF